MPDLFHFFKTFLNSAPLFIKGGLLTLELSMASIIIGVVVGLAFAFMSLSSNFFFRRLSLFYITLVRGTPLIVQIFVLYFGLTEIIRMSGFMAATLALAFHNGAYISEIFRGAIQSIDRGQYEAAKCIGMNSFLMYRRIILPQAFLRAIPPLGNQFIIAIKDSSLAAFISMDELFNVATTQGANHFDQMTYLLVVAVYYLTLVMALTFLFNKVEIKLKKSGTT